MKIKKILMLVAAIAAFSGCTTIKNIGEGITGTYMGGLERARANGKAKVFNYPIEQCFDKIFIILNNISAEPFHVDGKRYEIGAVITKEGLTEIDTESTYSINSADVGIFLTKVNNITTKVEISSLSSAFVDYASGVIFSQLERDTLEKDTRVGK